MAVDSEFDMAGSKYRWNTQWLLFFAHVANAILKNLKKICSSAGVAIRPIQHDHWICSTTYKTWDYQFIISTVYSYVCALKSVLILGNCLDKSL